MEEQIDEVASNLEDSFAQSKTLDMLEQERSQLPQPELKPHIESSITVLQTSQINSNSDRSIETSKQTSVDLL
jgi:hypothetical protein